MRRVNLKTHCLLADTRIALLIGEDVMNEWQRRLELLLHKNLAATSLTCGYDSKRTHDPSEEMAVGRINRGISRNAGGRNYNLEGLAGAAGFQTGTASRPRV